MRVVRRYPVGSKGYTAAISADGNTLALGETSGTVRVLDLASGRVREMRGGHDSTVYSASLSPDGRTLATGYKDGTVIVWDVKQGSPIETHEGTTPTPQRPCGPSPSAPTGAPFTRRT